MRALIAALLLAAPPPEAVKRLALSRAPLEYDRPIVADDLDGRWLLELTVMRNTIFARHGNVFRKAWLREYFEAQPWYQPTGLDDERNLPELERKNAEFIAEYEAKMPRSELKE